MSLQIMGHSKFPTINADSQKKLTLRIHEWEIDNIKCIFISPPFLNLVLSKNLTSWPMFTFKVNLFPKLY